ncbi:hypothetical protein [Anaerofustis sp.]|uniref:hypothetical protein n=1 Tax=Anaerofustis sp. TaxID=1872517 RepID=UPI0025B7D9E9|nr:hypothetical protein [Anaerofustis sp.]
MNALFIILNDTYLIDDVHEILSKCGVGGTFFNSNGLGKVNLDYDSDHTFTSVRKILAGDKPKNITIVSVIKSEEKLDEVTIEVMKLLNNIEEKGVGFMFVVPVLHVFGHKGKDMQ